MDDNGKYIRLFGTLFFTFIGFIVALFLIMFGLRVLFGVLNYIPWFSATFTMLIVCVPAVLFITVYLIYFKQTKTHFSAPVRYFSYSVFTVAIAFWLYFWVLDFIIFFKMHYNGISEYNCYNLAFLSVNVFAIFFVGIVQALKAKKEVNWMDRERKWENNLP